MSKQTFTPNKIISYFKTERVVLLIVTVSGLIYNLGLLAGPWFEGRMTGCLIDILNGRKTFYNMLILVGCYVLSSDRDRAEFEIYQAFLCQTFCQQRQPPHERYSLRQSGRKKQTGVKGAGNGRYYDKGDIGR